MIYQHFYRLLTVPIRIIKALYHHGHNAMYYITSYSIFHIVQQLWLSDSSFMHCIPCGYMNYMSYPNTTNLSHLCVVNITFTRVFVHKATFIVTDNAYLFYISMFGNFLLSAISVPLKQDDMENAKWLHLPPQFTLLVHKLKPQRAKKMH
jgi:hypothetical protein